MPNRILREGILSSERVALLNWQEEVFYRRLMSVVDDFGCYHANPKLLRAALYPLLIDKVSDADIGKWLTSCVRAALVSVYPASDGKRYLKLADFKQQTRAEKSKYPQAPIDCGSVAQQLLCIGAADAPVFGDGDGDVSGDGIAAAAQKKQAPPSDEPADDAVLTAKNLIAEGVQPRVADAWLKIRKAKKAPLTQIAWDAVKREAGIVGMTPAQAVKHAAESNWQGFKAVWIQRDQAKSGASGQVVETNFSRSRRERVSELTGGLAATKAPGANSTKEIFDADPPRLLG